MSAVVFAGFPNPVSWVIDGFKGFLGGVAESSAAAILGVLVSWVVDAAVWVVGGIVAFFLDASDPNVQAEWFLHGSTGDGPYMLTATIGAVLLVGFLLLGVIQGVMAGDVAGMVHRLVVHTPAAVVGMVSIVGVTQALIRLVDYLSGWVLSNFSADLAHFTTVVGSIATIQGGVATAFAVFVLALLVAVMGLVVFAELVVRGALVYIVVALAPLAFAVMVWPAMRSAARRLLELLLALILSKLIIAITLAIAAAALSGAGTGGNLATEAIPPPQPAENGLFAEDQQGSVTQAVGILLAGAAAFGVAAFSPLLAARLFPLTEAAMVAHGVKGMPVRGAQQAVGAARSLALTKAGAPLPAARAAPRGPQPSGAGGAPSAPATAARPANRAAVTPSPRNPRPPARTAQRANGAAQSAPVRPDRPTRPPSPMPSAPPAKGSGPPGGGPVARRASGSTSPPTRPRRGGDGG